MTASGEEFDAVQPFGFAIVVSGEWLIERVSANLAEFLPAEPLETIGRPLIEVLGVDAVHSLRNQVALMREPAAFTRLFACRAGTGGACFDFIVQRAGSRFLLEGQPSGPAEHSDATEMVRALLARLGTAKGLLALLTEAAKQLRAMTGYDRAAIYRVGSEGGDTLIAQSARKMGTAPGRLPSSLRWRASYILDRNATSVPLLPKESSGACEQALFGAVDTARHEWLERQGAAAAMMTPFRVGEGTWGLIVCTHPINRRMTLDREAAFELYADMLGMKVEIAELRQPSPLEPAA